MPKTVPLDLPALRSQALNALVLIFFTLFVVMLPRYTDPAKTWYALLILIGLGYLLCNFRTVADTSIVERCFLAVVVVNFLWTAASFYLNGEPGRGDSILWGRHFYLLFLVPMFFLFRRIRVPDKLLLTAIACSICLSLADMTIDLATGTNHLIQGMNPNAFGPIQVSLSGMLILYILLHPDNRYKWLILAGFVGGIVTIILSQSKGTWVTTVALALLLTYYHFRLRPLRVRVALVVLAVAMLGSSYLLPMVKIPIDSGIDNAASYFASKDYRDDARLGSFGERMELMRTGWYIFLEHPLLGAGVGSFRVLAKQNSERYQVHEKVGQYKYAHNQYIAALATRGVPGLILFLPLLCLPLYLAMRHKAADPGVEFARLSIILISVNYLLGNLWEDHFEGKSAIMFTTIMLPMLLARISPGQQEPRADPGR